MTSRKLASGPSGLATAADSELLIGQLAEIKDDGWLVVVAGEQAFACLWLETGLPLAPLAVGDLLLARRPSADTPGVVMGRLRPYLQLPPAVTLESTESLTLKCGEAQIDLRADGKVMVKGEDVLIRAKGTQRIRAGTVAIN